MRTLIVVLAVLCFIPSWASEPGQPLDCSDWVFLEPGLSCVLAIPYSPGDTTTGTRTGVVRAADNTGGILAVDRFVLQANALCESTQGRDLSENTC